MYKILLSLFFLILLTACKDSEPTPEEMIPDGTIDLVFTPYSLEFEKQAAKYGKEIDLVKSGVSIAMGSNSGNTLARFDITHCKQQNGSLITVDSTLWNLYISEDFREMALFRELAHCVLGRDKDQSDLAIGHEQSSILSYYLEANYTGRRKDYFIEELFVPGIAFPAWMTEKQTYSTNFQRELLVSETPADQAIVLADYLGVDDDFEVEMQVKRLKFGGITDLLWGNDDHHFKFRSEGSTYILYGVETESQELTLGSSLSVFGTYTRFAKWENEAPQFHKITIRRVGAVYQVFLDEQYEYVQDVLEVPVEKIWLDSQEEETGKALVISDFRLSKLF